MANTKKNATTVAEENTKVTGVEEVTTVAEVNTNPFTVREISDNNEPLRYSTTTDTVKLFNALNSPSQKLKDFIGNTLNITDIVVTSARVKKDINDKSENAEREDKPCVHFYTDMGEHITTVANGIIRAVQALLSCGLTPTPENPLKIKVITAETKSGTMHSFELV